MGNDRGGIGGLLIVLVIAASAVLYFGFNMVRFGWILKLVVALFFLCVLFCIGAVVWVILDAGKQRKKREEEAARKQTEEQLKHFDETHGGQNASENK